ncbi:FAD-binding oxidoreductase [Micromonospora peucetia]|uniref:FAD-binding oxidoreductase n=1 Tax=Micromonospora peucetia TaxID=47871 RepID=A0ABZ1EC94_9ACTN|nr:FAD-binding oxidoreductase [Micromonospora peucetia]WSA31235.1 FAD-binding oxidoreductase [Micromonospora peucetia]
MIDEQTHGPPVDAATTVTPADARYPGLVEGFNHRFTGRPEYVRLAGTTAHVVEALNEAVSTGRRIAVRSGGHCFEDFSASPDIAVLLDLSPMTGVRYDPRMRAVEVEAGATLGRVYPALYDAWGVTIPAGTCFEVGMGGHVTGGGYGHLSRRYGLVVDHLYAVEVVVVNPAGRAEVLVATREPDDPHRDLWWAMTGGGGGNFGVVTRFWLRSPDADGVDPSRLLPRAPERIRRRDVVWSWDGMSEAALARLVGNYCGWLEHNSAVGTPATNLWSNLIVSHRSAGVVSMTAVVDDAVPDAEKLLEGQLQAIVDGTGLATSTDTQEVVPWMASWMPSYSWPSDPQGRHKHKAGYLRRCPTDNQLATIARYLGDAGYTNPMACVVLTAFGGQVNAVGPDATASAQRDSVIKATYSGGGWQLPDDDERNIDWVRRFYRDVYADTGGVPVPGAVSDGSYISYPDVDLADPAWNTSGVAWHTLYYKGNYPRLQRVKQRYDPRDVFRHRLSVRPPA